MKETPKKLIQDIERELEIVKTDIICVKGELAKVNTELINFNWKLKDLQEKAKMLRVELLNIQSNSVSKERYGMVERIVFGLVALALTGMATAIINGALK